MHGWHALPQPSLHMQGSWVHSKTCWQTHKHTHTSLLPCRACKAEIIAGTSTDTINNENQNLVDANILFALGKIVSHTRKTFVFHWDKLCLFQHSEKPCVFQFKSIHSIFVLGGNRLSQRRGPNFALGQIVVVPVQNNMLCTGTYVIICETLKRNDTPTACSIRSSGRVLKTLICRRAGRDGIPAGAA